MKNFYGKKCLLDTNILVALLNSADRYHKKAKELYEELSAKNSRVAISSQNIFELTAVLVQAFGIEREKAVSDIRLIMEDKQVEVIYPDSRTTRKFLELLVKEPNLHTADVYLLATAIVFGLEVLLTADKKLSRAGGGEIKVINPFE